MEDGKAPPRSPLEAPGPSQGGGQTPASGPEVRDSTGRFIKGSTGNPGGRPKGALGFQARARQMSESMLTRLQLIALRGQGQAAVTAARVILAYAWGNPRQSVELTGENGGPLTGIGAPIDLVPLIRRIVKEPDPSGGAAPASAPPPPIATDHAA